MRKIEARLDRLESLVEQQQDRIDDQQATIETQQETIDHQFERIVELEGDEPDDATGTVDRQAPILNRRSALKAGGLLALLFGSVGATSADAQGQVGTSSDPLQTLYAAELNGPITDDGDESRAVTNLFGEGLTVDGESLTVATGNGVGFDDGNLAVATGNGVGFDDENLAVTTGNGVGFDGSGQLTIPTGSIDNDMLANDTVEILPENGVDSSGSVSLGGSVYVSINLDDFAGRNLAVDNYYDIIDYVPPENVIVVAKSDGGYTTVSGALTDIDDNAADNPYVIRVAPGVYNEEIQLKSHVDIVGSGINATRIETNNEYSETLQADDATNVEVRRMTAEGLYNALIVQNGGADVAVRQSRLRAVGDHADVVYHDAGALQLRNCLVECHGNSSTGIEIFGGTVDVANCQVVAPQDAISGPADVRHSQLDGGAIDLNNTFSVCNGNYDEI